MKTSTTQTNSQNNTQNKPLKLAGAVIFWLIIWQILSMYIGYEIILASPISVAKKLLEMIPTLNFWQSLFATTTKIATGFLISLILGGSLAFCASKSQILATLLSVPMKVIKATPVVSFIILCIIWVGSQNLSVAISATMVMPIFYTNLLSGIQNANQELLEMAKVFNVPPKKIFSHIKLFSLKEPLISATKIGAGLCWKSGVAAEVIGIPRGTIGEALYISKIYFDTASVLAWTVAIVVLSIILEKLAVKAIQLFYKHLEKTL